MQWNVVTFSQSIFTIRFITGDCRLTRVELSLYKWPWMLTHAGEACTSRKLKPGLGTRTKYSYQCERSLSLCPLEIDW